MTSSAGCSGLILRRVAAHALHGVAHGGQIDDGRHAGEVLQQHARRHEGDLVVGLALGSQAPALDVGFLDGAAVFEPQQVLQQDAQRVGQPRRIDPGLRQRGQAVNLVFAGSNFQGRASAKRIRHALILRGKPARCREAITKEIAEIRRRARAADDATNGTIRSAP